MAINVCDLMTREVVYADEGSSAFDVSQVLTFNNISCVVVKSGKRAVGLLTERDLVQKVLAKGLDPSKVKVSEIMSKPLVTILQSSSLEDATRLMRDKMIKKLVVVSDSGEVEGVITSYDVVVTEPVISILSDDEA